LSQSNFASAALCARRVTILKRKTVNASALNAVTTSDENNRVRNFTRIAARILHAYYFLKGQDKEKTGT